MLWSTTEEIITTPTVWPIDLVELRANIRALIELEEAKEPVVSCYLNVGARGSAFAGRKASEIRRTLVAAERAVFDAALESISQFVDTKVRPGTKGLALFSRSGSSPFFMGMQFQVRVEEQLSLSPTPSIYGLVELKDTYHRYVVLLVTEDYARILEISLGAVTADLWAARPDLRDRVGSSWTRAQYQNHKRDRTDRFIAEKVKVLDRLMAKGGHSHLIVAGSPVLTARVRAALPPHLAAKLVDIVDVSATTSTSDVVLATISSYIAQEEKASLDAVALLVQQIKRGGLAIAGTDGTLGALETGRVDMLLMADAYQAPAGWGCRSCGAVQLSDHPLACLRCGDSHPTFVDVKDEMVKLAERHAATFELVRHSDVMMELGGVGCLLRYEEGWRPGG